MLDERSDFARKSACNDLANLLPDRTAADALLRMLEDPLPEIRRSVLMYHALDYAGVPVPLLIAAMKDPSDDVRRDAIRAAVDFADDQLVVAELRQIAASDANPSCRRQAYRCLSELGIQDPVPAPRDAGGGRPQ